MMTETFWNVFDNGILALETMMLLIYVGRNLEARRISGNAFINTLVRLCLTLLLGASHMALRYFLVDTEGVIFLSAVCDFIFCAILYNGTLDRLTTHVVSFYIILIILDLTAFLLWPVSDMDNELFIIAAVIITRLCLLPILIIGQSIAHHITRYTSRIMYIPITSVSTILIIIVFMTNETNLKNIRPFGIILLISAAVLNVCTAALYLHAQKSQEEKERLAVLEAHRKAQEIYFRSLKEEALSASAAVHDSRHHLGIILSFLEAGMYDKAKEYIVTVDTRMAQKKAYTGNQTVDTILNSQMSFYSANSVPLSVFGVLPARLPFDEVDLCIIIANALENAMEECMRLSVEKEKGVSIAFRYEVWLQINVKNPYVQLPEKAACGRLLSKKRGCHSPGIGLDSIEKACARQNGFMVIQTHNDTFTLTATLQPQNGAKA